MVLFIALMLVATIGNIWVVFKIWKDSADGVAVLWAVSVASAVVRCTGG